MKILRLAVVAAAVAALQGAAAEAGGARQKLPHVARVAEARPEAALKRLSALEAGPTATAALGPGLRVVPVICRPSGVQPVCAETVRIDGSAGEWRPAHKVPGCVEGSVAAWGPLAVLAAPVARTAPAYRAAASTAALDVDPFLTPCEVWKWSPLGDLRGEALVARERGELGRFERLQALYWERMMAALERRRVLGGGREEAGGRQ